MFTRFGLALLLSTISCLGFADCVEGAKTKTKFSRLNSHTIALTGGYGDAIVIKTSCLIKKNSDIAVLKDSFCSFSDAVLDVDGNECDAENVDLGDKFNKGRLWDEDDWDPVVD